MHDTLFLFGATGDLAQRYLFPSLLRLLGDGLLPEDWTALEELCAGRGHIHPLEVPADLFADAPVARALEELAFHSKWVRLLGSYPMVPPEVAAP